MLKLEAMGFRDPLRPRTRAEMREVDRRASSTSSGSRPLLSMENAGRGAAEVAADMARPHDGGVIVGGVNNGGDGFVVARHLANRGYTVECYHAGALYYVERGSDPGVADLAILRNMGVRLQHAKEADREQMAKSVAGGGAARRRAPRDGLSCSVREPYSTLISFCNDVAPRRSSRSTSRAGSTATRARSSGRFRRQPRRRILLQPGIDRQSLAAGSPRCRRRCRT